MWRLGCARLKVLLKVIIVVEGRSDVVFRTSVTFTTEEEFPRDGRTVGRPVV